MKTNRIVMGLIGSMVVILFVYVYFHGIAFKQDTVYLEYGKKLDIHVEDLVKKKDTSGMSLDISDVNKANGVPEVGEYTMYIHYPFFGKERIEPISLIVKDIKSPELIHMNQDIHVPLHEKNFDFSSVFEIKDASKTSIKVDTDAIDFDQPGKYKTVLILEDAYHNKTKEKINVIVDKNSEDGLYRVNGILVVNKKHPLPVSYAPGEDAEAVKHLQELIHDMQNEGLDVSDSYSGFRDYNYQSELYNNYVNTSGQEEADSFSARPGYSEHQTGLAFDLKHISGELITEKPEADWLLKHAADYGFIVRFQEGKEAITGYQPEPWHIRYIGKEAKKIMQEGCTLEEYLGVDGGDYIEE